MIFSIRNIAAFFAAWMLILSGKMNRLRKRAANGDFLLSVYFHDPSKKLFESCVKWFLRKGFTIISADDYEQIASGKKPFPKSAVILTVDDGWRNNKENIAAVANQYKIPVTIFASTQPIETGEGYWWSYIAAANKQGLVKQSVTACKKLPNEERVRLVNEVKVRIPLEREALTIDELKDISNTPFVSIGSHTVTHPILSTCGDVQAQDEIVRSKQILESWLHTPVNHFAYPNGDYQDREIKNLQTAGYRLAFTTQTHYITPENIAHVYTIPRFDVLETISFTENICRMTGLWFNKSLFNEKH
jgi:peptidoglycan/xylan/chitin deacetylase (PgdA/CDA1 family)